MCVCVVANTCADLQLVRLILCHHIAMLFGTSLWFNSEALFPKSLPMMVLIRIKWWHPATMWAAIPGSRTAVDQTNRRTGRNPQFCAGVAAASKFIKISSPLLA